MGKHLTATAILFAYLLLTFNCLAQTPSLEWAKQLHGSADVFAYEVVVDDSSNVYVAGSFRGTTDFDPGTSIYNLTALGRQDAFLCKLNYHGDFVWAKQFGDTSEEHIMDLVLDASTNIYFVVNDLLDTSECQIVKLNRQGDVIWNKATGGSTFSIALDSSGHIYSTGYLIGTSDFDPGVGLYNLTSTGQEDAFILKLDTGGNFIWAKQITGTSFVEGVAIAVDTKDNIVVAGNFYLVADFDPNAGTAYMSANNIPHPFIAKYDTAGRLLWAKQTGKSLAKCDAMVLDAEDNIIYTGFFGDTVDFDPGTGVFDIESFDFSLDVFVSKLDSGGNFLWAKQLGGPDYDEAFGLTTDALGNIYNTGYFVGVADFDPGPDVFPLYDALADIYLSQLDANGNFIWAGQVGGASNDQGMGIVVDGIQNIYATGVFLGKSDFDPSIDTFYLKPAITDSFTTFVLKIKPCTDSHTVIDTAVCYTYVGPSGQIWNSTGVYYDTLANSTGCDSIITVTLAIIAIDASIAISNDTLISNAAGADYQWVQCSDTGLTSITDATANFFIPLETGAYAVIVTQNGCTDTSETCITFTRVGGIGFNNKEEVIKATPNPTTGAVSIKLGQAYKQVEVTIMDMTGRLIDVHSFFNVPAFELSLTGEAGVYFVQVRNEFGEATVLRVVKW